VTRRWRSRTERRRGAGPYGRPEPRACNLCGRESVDVMERPVRWDEAVVAMAGIPEFETVLRCPHAQDQDCRARVERAGGTWHVVDVTTQPTVRQIAEPQHEEVPI